MVKTCVPSTSHFTVTLPTARDFPAPHLWRGHTECCYHQALKLLCAKLIKQTFSDNSQGANLKRQANVALTSLHIQVRGSGCPDERCTYRLLGLQPLASCSSLSAPGRGKHRPCCLKWKTSTGSEGERRHFAPLSPLLTGGAPFSIPHLRSSWVTNQRRVSFISSHLLAPLGGQPTDWETILEAPQLARPRCESDFWPHHSSYVPYESSRSKPLRVAQAHHLSPRPWSSDLSLLGINMEAVEAPHCRRNIWPPKKSLSPLSFFFFF